MLEIEYDLVMLFCYSLELISMILCLSKLGLLTLNKNKKLILFIIGYYIIQTIISSISELLGLMIAYVLPILFSFILCDKKKESMFYAISVVFIIDLLFFEIYYIQFVFPDISNIIILLLLFSLLLSIPIIVTLHNKNILVYSKISSYFNYVILVVLMILRGVTAGKMNIYFSKINIICISIIAFVAWLVIHGLIQKVKR